MKRLASARTSERGAPPLDAVIRVMREASGRDLSCFDEAFLAKSLQRRLADTALETWPAYVDHLARDDAEAEALCQSLNIGYSEFFRDPLAFALLEQVVLPALAQEKEKSGRSALRVWSAGCAAGQEAWSMAILLEELSTGRERPVAFRIFATDSAAASLAEARAGVYGAAAVQQLRLKHLRKYFSVSADAYRIAAALKTRVDFSAYDLLAEGSSSPAAGIYGDFDLILCCNLLFYYRPEARQRILDKICRALRPGGYCVTGATEREIVARQAGLHAVAPPAAVFQKRSRSSGE